MILHNIAVINFQSEDMIAVSKKKHIEAPAKTCDTLTNDRDPDAV